LTPSYVKEIIENHGLKKYFVAAQCLIPVQRLSSYLSNKGTLGINQEHRLRKFIETLIPED